MYLCLFKRIKNDITMSTAKKILFIAIATLLVAGGIFYFFKFKFVLGEGVKAGELNQLVYKGWVWKTYEGRLIQTGFKGSKNGNGIQSNEFNFSVTDKEVAEKLMRCSGKHVELHYKEYNGWLPWRGMQRYIVDKILAINDSNGLEQSEAEAVQIPFEN